MINRIHCEGCPLEDIGRPMDPQGSDTARFMVVVDTPSRFSAAKGRVLPESSTRLFAKHMDLVGFSREEFVFVPQIRCPHEADQLETKQKREIKKHCREHLLEDIQHYNPELIVPLGAEPASQVFGRAVKITKIRGVVSHSEEHGTNVMPLLSPGQVTMYPQHEGVFSADCRSMARAVNSEYDMDAAGESLLGKYEFIEDLQFLIDRKPKLLFFDTETTSLEYFREGTDDVRDYDPVTSPKDFNPSAAILTLQFCTKPGEAYMLVWDHPERPIPQRRKKRILQQLTQLLCAPHTRVLGQNAKYDNTYVFAQTGIRYKIGGDTLMIAALLDENMLSKGQDVLVKHYAHEMGGYADSFNATVDKSRMWEVPLDKLIDYGCGDVDSGMLLYKAMIKELLKDERLFEHYRHVSLPGLNVFSSVETRGILIDEAALDAFETTMAESVATQYTSLIAQVPKAIKRKHIDKGLKFSRADFVRDILFRDREGFRLRPKVFTDSTKNLSVDKRVPSTSTKDHLPYFYDECPFAMELAQYVKDERLLGTNIRSFKKKYVHNGLVRPTYSLWTAVTGRSASENPNGQNFPKRGPNAKAYRRIFVAPPGYYVLEADLSQAELRIAADMAHDRAMLDIYGVNGDIHSATAAIVVGVPLQTFMQWKNDKRKLIEVANSIPGSGNYLRKLPPGRQREATVKDYYSMKRQEAKAINFGFVYGMGWRKFIGYAKTQYGVEFTEQEAQDIRTTFFDTYYGLPLWHEAMRQFAHREAYVRSYSGRIRHLPMIYSDDEGVASEAGRQAINCLSDDTEILTVHGWKTVDEIRVGDIVYSANTSTGALEEDRVNCVNVGNYSGRMLSLEGSGISALSTPNHRWVVDTAGQGANKGKVFTSFKASEDLSMHGGHKLWLSTSGGTAEATVWEDNEVRLLGWILTDGHYKGKSGGRVGVTQSKSKNVSEICRIFAGVGKHHHTVRSTGQHVWEVTSAVGQYIRDTMPDKTLTAEVLRTMSSAQHRILFDTMLKGDGCWDEASGRYRKFCAGSQDRADAFLQLCALIGQPARAYYRDTSGYALKKYASMGNIPKTEGHWLVELKQRNRTQPQYGASWVEWSGRVWCPTTTNGTWVAKRNGRVFITGNSPVQGFGSDLGIMACGRIYEEIDSRFLAPVAFVHDAIFAYVPKRYVEWGAKTLKHYMESNDIEGNFGIRMECPIIADVSFGLNFGDTNELGGLSLDAHYDFSEFWNEEEQKGIQVPPQSIPPNRGRLIVPPYTQILEAA